MIQFKDDLPARLRIPKLDSGFPGLDVKAINHRLVVELKMILRRFFADDTAVLGSLSPGGAGQIETPVSALVVRNGKVEMMARVVGKGVFAGVGGFKADLKP